MQAVKMPQEMPLRSKYVQVHHLHLIKNAARDVAPVGQGRAFSGAPRWGVGHPVAQPRAVLRVGRPAPPKNVKVKAKLSDLILSVGV